MFVKKIAIVGNPNVGKSILFNGLTKQYATVSNYPGTTVEVLRARMRLDGAEYEVIDTPGMYSLLSITEEEKVARDILINERPDIVIHVVDAKNLERMLLLTLQLIESNLDVILVLNIMDEAEREGISIDVDLLQKDLNIPVVPTVSITGKGIDDLKRKIGERGKKRL